MEQSVSIQPPSTPLDWISKIKEVHTTFEKFSVLYQRIKVSVLLKPNKSMLPTMPISASSPAYISHFGQIKDILEKAQIWDLASELECDIKQFMSIDKPGLELPQKATKDQDLTEVLQFCFHEQFRWILIFFYQILDVLRNGFFEPNIDQANELKKLNILFKMIGE